MKHDYGFAYNTISFDTESRIISVKTCDNDIDLTLAEFKEYAAFIGFVLSKEEVNKPVIPTNGKHAIK